MKLTIGEEIKAHNLCNKGARIGPFQMEKFLGGGAFGQVYQAIDQSNQTRVAIKVVDIDVFKGQAQQALKRRLAEDEETHLKKFNSPNIIKYKGSFSNTHLIGIIMELCEGGNLLQFLVERETVSNVTEQEALGIIKQILCGISQLHSKNILHRDIKPQNILIHNEFYIISDLGFSKYQPQNIKATNLGTVNLKAPQVIFGRPYCKPIDIWSIGVTLYRIVYGQYPFPTDSDKLKNVIEKPLKYPPCSKNKVIISKQMKIFLSELIELNPEKRITAQQALQHKIFQTKFLNISESYIPLVPQYEVVVQSAQNTEAKKQHFMCLKSQFIYERIIGRIEKSSLMKKQTRKERQFLYLLASRCWLYMSCFNHYYQQNNIRDSSSNSSSVIELFQRYQMKELYKKVNEKFQYYSRLLRQKQSQTFEIFKDSIKKIINSRQQNKKIVLINGIQKVDFQFEEHLNFINNYIPDIIEESISKESYQYRNQVVAYLQRFKEINLLDCQQIYKKKSTFINEVRKLTGLKIRSNASSYC